jgi:curved DNA-binding protein CbpA
MSQNAPYTKKRFYELVKLYHPDKHDHSTALDHIPQAVRLERYRLIVAANDLLSDVAKRRLYDNHGLGWTGTRTPTINESVRYQDHLWRDREHSPAGNATWEDWERWHQRRDGKPTEPLYMSNGVFATLIVALCMIGAFTQMSRAENIGNQYIDQVDRLHTSVAADVQKSAVAAQRRNRDEQVESFLRDRENAAFVFVPSRYDATQKRE